MGSFNFFLLAYFFAFSKLSSSDTIIKATLLVSVALYNFSIEGISARQGGHQVAHRLTNIFLPLKSCKLTGLPLTSINKNSGRLSFVAPAVLLSEFDCSTIALLSLVFAIFSLHAVITIITNTVTTILSLFIIVFIFQPLEFKEINAT